MPSDSLLHKRLRLGSRNVRAPGDITRFLESCSLSLLSFSADPRQDCRPVQCLAKLLCICTLVVVELACSESAQNGAVWMFPLPKSVMPNKYLLESASGCGGRHNGIVSQRMSEQKLERIDHVEFDTHTRSTSILKHCRHRIVYSELERFCTSNAMHTREALQSSNTVNIGSCIAN